MRGLNTQGQRDPYLVKLYRHTPTFIFAVNANGVYKPRMLGIICFYISRSGRLKKDQDIQSRLEFRRSLKPESCWATYNDCVELDLLLTGPSLICGLIFSQEH